MTLSLTALLTGEDLVTGMLRTYGSTGPLHTGGELIFMHLMVFNGIVTDKESMPKISTV